MKKCIMVLSVICAMVFYSAISLAETKIFVYPNNKQDSKLQERDEKDCHSWAQEQTGDDLEELDSLQEDVKEKQQVDRYQKAYEDKSKTFIQGQVEVEEDVRDRINDYIRAFSACMEARGYSVR